MQAIRESNKVSDDDVDLLAKYILVSKLAGNDMEGKSYDDILDKIKTIRKANSEESDRKIEEEELKRERLEPLLTVKLLEKKFSSSGSKDQFTYTVSFQNTSPNNFKMILGSISLNDLLDKEIKRINIVVDEELKANSVITKTFTADYDNNSENDKRIRTKDLTDIRVEWNPDKIIFANGRVAE